MAAARDYYDVLGVAHDADSNTIRNAYRRLAKRLHPDVCRDGSADAFREVRAAFEPLSDPGQRGPYDEGLAQPVEPRRSPRQRRPPAHVAHGEIVLSPDEAAAGGVVSLEVPLQVVCPTCEGTGGLLLDCLTCDGLGLVEGTVPCRVVVPPGICEGAVLETVLDHPIALTLRLSVGVEFL
jgi:DnaJ-class molecular chaperone